MAESPPPITVIGLPLKKEAVTCGAGGHAMADQRLLIRQSQPSRGSSAGDNQVCERNGLAAAEVQHETAAW